MTVLGFQKRADKARQLLVKPRLCQRSVLLCKAHVKNPWLGTLWF